MTHSTGNYLVWLVAILMFLGILLWLGFLWMRPSFSERASNEHKALVAMREVAKAEFEFREKDLDENGVKDFWTGDVAGLYGLTVGGKRIELIDQALAEADTSPLTPLVNRPHPFYGHYIVALESDGSISNPERGTYRQDTGGSPPMGKVHNKARFGFCIYPAERALGRYMWIINQDNVPRRCSTSIPIPKIWPNDCDLKKDWVPIDQVQPN